MNLVKNALTGLALTCTVSVAAQAETLVPGTITVGGDLTQPPYNYFDSDKQAAGFDPEFLRALAAAAGAEVAFTDTRFENLILGLNARKFDVIASALYVRAERAKQIDFIPYMKTGVSIGVSATSDRNLQKPEDLCGLKVSSIKGGAWIPAIIAMSQTACGDKGPVDLREFPTAAEATQAVMAGNVDAQLEDSAILKQAADMTGGRFKVSSKENLYPVVVGLGIRKGNDALKTQLEEAFEKIAADGTYQALLDKYNVAAPTQQEYEASIR